MEYINNYIEIGKEKIKNTYLKTIVLAIMAGIFIAFAGLSTTIITSKIDNFGISRLVSGLIFPVGLILVILLKTELFTGNSLLVIPLIKKEISFKQLLRNWILVYLGNLIGSIIIALLVYYGGIYLNITDAIIKIANTKINYSFLNSFILGTMCNFLVCIAVYLGVNYKNTIDKIIVIFIPVMLFIIIGLEHSVANMYYLSIAYIIDNSITLVDILNNLIPVTLGNILGGSLFAISRYYLK